MIVDGVLLAVIALLCWGIYRRDRRIAELTERSELARIARKLRR